LAKLRQLVFFRFKMAKKTCLLDFQEAKFQKKSGKNPSDFLYWVLDYSQKNAKDD
jgi:hypothetical protein